MRTARHLEIWLHQGLAAFHLFAILLVLAQAAESQWREEHRLLVKHMAPEIPETSADSENEMKPVPVQHVLIATEASHCKEAIATQVAETLTQG